MLDVRLEHPADLDGWRAHARALIARQIAPEAITWRVSDEPLDLFAPQSARAPHDAPHDAPNGAPNGAPNEAPALVVPRQFAELARGVICHRHRARFSLLYRLLWRITRGERRLLAILTNPDVHRATSMARSVGRDVHKMKGFVRFRGTQDKGAEHYIAWFEPQHFIVERVAPFFARRFAGMLWSILTPDRSAHWDGERLSFGAGTAKAEVPSEDALADVWRRYYASIFNPARLKLTAMKGQMPVSYWKNLPEARLIAPLAASAAGRTQVMLAASSEPTPRMALSVSAKRSHGHPPLHNALSTNQENRDG